MNKAAGHFFIFNGVCFGFCMSRITTFVMRIGKKTRLRSIIVFFLFCSVLIFCGCLEWAQNPTSISIAIAANVFVSAGVILLYVINMNFCQRTVRGYHPRFYNSKLFKNVFLAYYISLIAVLIMGKFVVLGVMWLMAGTNFCSDCDYSAIILYPQPLGFEGRYEYVISASLY